MGKVLYIVIGGAMNVTSPNSYEQRPITWIEKTFTTEKEAAEFIMDFDIESKIADDEIVDEDTIETETEGIARAIMTHDNKGDKRFRAYYVLTAEAK